jgi:hypothetical protein
MEQVSCQYCGHDREITEDTTCPCGAELWLTQTLQERIRSFEARIISLRMEQGKAVAELCRRERLRNVRQGCGQTSGNFWQGVVGKPSWAGRPKQAVQSLQIDMAAFD